MSCIQNLRRGYRTKMYHRKKRGETIRYSLNYELIFRGNKG